MAKRHLNDMSKARWSWVAAEAVVTGGGQGIGRQICIDLALKGASVCAVSRTEIHLATLKEEVEKLGHTIKIFPCDLEDTESTKTIIGKLLSENKIDMLVNNAGMNRLSPFLEIKEEDWDTILNVNLKATFIISQLVAKQMVNDKRPGSIVNVSSQASVVALPDHTAYCVAKGGMDQLTRMMATELGKHQIRVNSVNPTVVLTELGKAAWGTPEKGGPMLEKIPLKKFAEISDVVEAVLFLLSEKARMINGIIMPIDGGFLCTR